MVLIDVARIGSKVRLVGLARAALAGQTVVIQGALSGKPLGASTVRPGGFFEVLVPRPASRDAATARYRATVGTRGSASLRLARRLAFRA